MISPIHRLPGKIAPLHQAPDDASGIAQVEHSVDLLMQAENRILKLVADSADEATVFELAHILRDLSIIRMRIESLDLAGRRASARIQEPAVALIERPGGRPLEAAVHNLSMGGCLIECDQSPGDNENINLRLPGFDAIAGTIRTTCDGLTHVAFEPMLPAQVLELVKYIGRQFQRY